MSKVSRNALVPFSAQQMFELVNNTEQYPEFVPWCSNSEEKIFSDNKKQATLYFSRGAIKTSFTTENDLVTNEKIGLNVVDGPFSELQGEWRFIDIGEAGSKVELDVEFELSNRMLKLALESFFTQVCDRLVNAFVQRANQIYQ